MFLKRSLFEKGTKTGRVFETHPVKTKKKTIMKNIKRFTATAAFIVFTTIAFSQTAPPPNNGTTGSGGGTPVGGGAPIGGGLMILASMGLAYGYAKFKFGGNGDSGFEEVRE